MAAQGNSSQKLKFSEWRPIGVCDDAPPGVQKAQMFTRQDFLIITAPGINRNNWQKKAQVVKILRRYTTKLAKQSTITNGMKKPTVSSITLVGAIMKLAVTPDLNRESKDGKIQLFQIKYEDKAVKKKTPWGIILGILLVILLILCIILGIAIYKKTKSKSYKTKKLRFPSYTISYCEDPMDRSRYEHQLDEVNRILQPRVEDLLYQRRLEFETNCIEYFPQLSLKEKRFLKCYSLIKQHGILSQIPFSDLKKVNACKKEICRRDQFSGSAACLKR